MRYAIIERERGKLPVKRACLLLKVSESGYYAWQKRGVGRQRDAHETSIVEQITDVFVESKGTYGSPRVTAALRQRGIVCNHKCVARVMRQQQLVAKYRRRRVNTTDSRHAYPVAPNRLQRDFSARRPNEKWLADITSIDTAEGWLYLALLLDVFSRKVVGWAMGVPRDKSLVERAFNMAMAQRRPTSGDLLHHSDRGSQCASLSDQQQLQTAGITVSMSRAADPYDNALMESAIGTLKTECAHHRFPSHQAARSELFAYLEGWYNRRRLHSALGYLSPDQFELRFLLDTDSLYSTG